MRLHTTFAVADMWKQPLALSINDLFMPARPEGGRPTRGSQTGRNPLQYGEKKPSRKLRRVLFLAMLS